MIAVKLSFTQLMDAVKQLSPSEKLELNEAIWKDDVAIPVEHQELVSARKQSAEDNPGLVEDWETASKKLRF